MYLEGCSQKRGVGNGGGGQLFLVFWGAGVGLYISYIKCKGRGQNKYNFVAKLH